jgi:WG containing repeat
VPVRLSGQERCRGGPRSLSLCLQFLGDLGCGESGKPLGYIDPSGLFKITPRFEGTRQGPSRIEETKAGYFVNGLAPVWSGHGYGFIDTAGKFVIEGGFDEANSFCEGRAVVKRGKRFGFVDSEGRMSSECKFTLARDFSEGLARLIEEEPRVGFYPPSGFINLHGQMVIEPLFYSAGSFQDGLCLVETEDSIGYINKQGEYVQEGALCRIRGSVVKA